ncbi:MAG: DUF58 domain-containing protein [Planctomycetota bacterium]
MSDGKLRPKSMDLLTPEALDRLGRLAFVARGVVEGFVTGLHKSPYKGFSAEFAEHRQYVPGDDIHDLDWRVYARNDRYYVKQYIEETNLRATILLDASASMRYTGGHAARLNGRRLSKFEYARYLAASLAYLMINQQDAVGLVTFDAAIRRYVPARSRPTHLRILLDEMYQAQASDVTRIAPVFHEIAERVHRRGLIMIVSDLFDDPEELLTALHHFRYRKHEVVLIHVMAEEELTFPFTMWKKFRSLEIAGQEIQLDARAVRAAYLDRVHEFVRKLETGCGQMHIDYVPMCTREPFEVALSDYLAARQSRGR